MGKIIFGIIFIIGGFSGKLVLAGTNSSTALVIVGFILVGIGIYQMTLSQEDVAEINGEDKPIIREVMCIVRDEKMVVYNKTHESLGVLTELDVNDNVVIDLGTDFDRFYKVKTSQGSIGYVLKTSKFVALA
jgi:hypothetical protein